MPPKPFPSSLRVGVDICHMPRFGQLLTDYHQFNYFVRRIFNRLEWPDLQKKIFYAIKENEEDTPISEGFKPNLALKFPSITTTLLKGNERSAQASLLRHITGRWAAKEAAIKAHSTRRLRFHEVTILEGARDQSAEDRGFRGKASILIDPPCGDIWISEHIAKVRGLSHTKPAFQSGNKSHVKIGRIIDDRFVEGDTDGAQRFFRRRAKIPQEARQCADVSISHDGEYATAVCIAQDEWIDSIKSKAGNIDDGSGDSLHEPEWGDNGFLRYMKRNADTNL